MGGKPSLFALPRAAVDVGAGAEADSLRFQGRMGWWQDYLGGGPPLGLLSFVSLNRATDSLRRTFAPAPRIRRESFRPGTS
jgi:hypothetical protein